jgi:hypothetical protein
MLNLRQFETLEQTITIHTKYFQIVSLELLRLESDDATKLRTLIQLLFFSFAIFNFRIRYRMDLFISMEYCNSDLVNCTIKLLRFAEEFT